MKLHATLRHISHDHHEADSTAMMRTQKRIVTVHFYVKTEQVIGVCDGRMGRFERGVMGLFITVGLG